MSTAAHGLQTKLGRVVVSALQKGVPGELDQEEEIEAAKGRVRRVDVLSGLNRFYYLYKSSKA